MLTKLVIKDFKSFKRQELLLSTTGMTVLVGPNGSGKSTVLQAAAEALELYSVRRPGEEEERPAEREWLRRGADGYDISATVDVSRLHPAARVEVQSKYVDGRSTHWAEVVVGSSRETFLPNEGVVPPSIEIGGVTLVTDALYRALPVPRTFAVDLGKLRHPLHPRPGPEYAELDAEQVVQRLLDMRLGSDVRAVERLVEEVRSIVPSVKGVALKRYILNGVEKYGLKFDMTTGDGIDASQVSEGTLLTLALCVATHSDGPTLLLIDDIDRALHPVAQRQLVSHLRAMVAARPMQVLCTSHSPYILGEFKYEEVRVLRELDGESRCMALDQGPEADRWMKELDAGEYWSFFESKLFARQSA